MHDAPACTINATENQIKIYQEWQHKKVKDCFADDIETSIQAKLETYVWRLALIIEMMHQASINDFKEELSDTSIFKALKLIEYFRLNALRVFDKISSNNPLEELPTNKIDLAGIFRHINRFETEPRTSLPVRTERPLWFTKT